MNRRHFGKCAVVSLAIASGRQLAFADASSPEAWSGWRGPKRTAYVPARIWPDKLDSDHLKLVWDVPLEKSYSGPVVIGDQVITTESRAKDQERTIAFDRSSGQERWATNWSGSMSVPFFAASNGSWIRSTPVTDGTHIYVGGMCDYLACLDVRTGEKKYTIDFKERFGSPLPSFGQVCSPILDESRLYIQSGGGVVCLDAITGATVWRSLVDKDGMNSAFSSPMIETLHGVRQLIVQTRNELCGVELSSGNLLWQKKVESFRGMNILTPTIWNNSIFTSSYGGKSLMFDFEPNESGAWKVNERWSAKAEAYMSSPVVIGAHLYVHLRNQRLVCIDLASGEEQWRSRPYGKYWSMLTNGKQILALDEQGKLLLINANPKAFELVDERVVSQNECWAHVAMVDQQIFVRHLLGLSVFHWS